MNLVPNSLTMCIAASVGRNGINSRDDVKTVQILLNLNISKIIPLRLLAEDGGIGRNTIGAIEEFQRRVLCQANPDGRVDPNGRTLQKLRDGVPVEFSEAILRGIMIHANQVNISKYFSALSQKMAQNGIDTPLRKAHFLAQLAHESAELTYAEEIASGQAYEGRADLGNTQPGDGKRFKGRGLIQITGRSNYQAYGEARGRDYTTGDSPRLLATDPFTAADCSSWFWVENDLNALADLDDVLKVTKRINGGTNGLDDRRAKLVRAKFFLTR